MLETGAAPEGATEPSITTPATATAHFAVCLIIAVSSLSWRPQPPLATAALRAGAAPAKSISLFSSCADHDPCRKAFPKRDVFVDRRGCCKAAGRRLRASSAHWTGRSAHRHPSCLLYTSDAADDLLCV